MDILETKKTKKVETTMYEVGDRIDRKFEFSGDGYLKSFWGFVESLGYDVSEKFPDSDHRNSFQQYIIINGVEFEINVDNASYMSRNAYTREDNVRKPQNRFIALTYRSKNIVKIFFNKEYETKKLKTKIDAAIQKDHDIELEIVDRKNRDRNNTAAIAAIYMNNTSVSEAITLIKIHRGEVRFYFHDAAYSLAIKTDNSFVQVSFDPEEMKSPEEFVSFVLTVKERADKIALVVSDIINSNKMSDELVQWAAEAYERTFYCETMSADWDEHYRKTSETKNQ